MLALSGLDRYQPSRVLVENNTGADLSPLRAIRLDGMGLNYPQVELADPTTYSTFGITTKNIFNGSVGQVTTVGIVYDLDTSAWADNDVLYSDASGNLSTTPLNPSDPAVAVVLKQDAVFGVLNVVALVSKGTSGGGGNSWDLTGNSLTNPAANFVGTTDNKPINFRTNNQFVAKFTEQGRFSVGEQNPDEFTQIKAHTGYVNSGHRRTTYALTTADTSWNMAYSFTLPNNCVMQITVTAIGYTPSTLSRCSFKKTATIWREATIAVLAAIPQSDYSYRTDENQGMRVRSLGNQVIVEVRSSEVNTTKWTGSIDFDITGSS
jgi:hypothetical protein